ncbi:MAG: hypothetical protein MK231_04820 [Pelagibacterales bacterium]|nr:hypothetical protein [Pelagibacterales bacterium]
MKTKEFPFSPKGLSKMKEFEGLREVPPISAPDYSDHGFQPIPTFSDISDQSESVGKGQVGKYNQRKQKLTPDLYNAFASYNAVVYARKNNDNPY